ncbi:MAG: pyridoxamine 5'-phosphate oxidase [Actinomycetota bacterium]|nr:pyridoxamine 5'-phosphate oxidase [Actinomycetota bacterium]
MSPRRPDLPSLDREDLAGDPIAQFSAWWEDASDVPLRDAMTLSTIDHDDRPDARMVLLKGFGDGGFRFFTNYESAKAAQLDGAGQAALIVYWRELDRQVRVRGQVERLGAEASDEYFASRPRDSQLGAWASPQSRSLRDRAELDSRLNEVKERFGQDGEVPRPQHWGGYVVRHEIVEFWQGQVGRLHDRFAYRRTDDGWQIERLGP